MLRQRLRAPFSAPRAARERTGGLVPGVAAASRFEALSAASPSCSCPLCVRYGLRCAKRALRVCAVRGVRRSGGARGVVLESGALDGGVALWHDADADRRCATAPPWLAPLHLEWYRCCLGSRRVWRQAGLAAALGVEARRPGQSSYGVGRFPMLPGRATLALRRLACSLAQVREHVWRVVGSRMFRRLATPPQGRACRAGSCRFGPPRAPVPVARMCGDRHKPSDKAYAAATASWRVAWARSCSSGTMPPRPPARRRCSGCRRRYHCRGSRSAAGLANGRVAGGCLVAHGRGAQAHRRFQRACRVA